MMFLIAIVLLSPVWHQAQAGRLQNLERKLHAFEMSVIQDIHLLREDIFLAKDKIEEVLASMNSTSSLQVIDGTSIQQEEEHKIADRIEQKMESLVHQQLKRVKRAFVSEKMQIIAKQREQESNFTSQARKLQNALEAMTEKVDSSINSSSWALRESVELNAIQIDEQVSKVKESVNETLLRVERSVNASLLEIGENEEKMLNTMTEKLENGIDKISQIGQNLPNNELFLEMFQAVQSIQFTSLMTMILQANSQNSDFDLRFAVAKYLNLKTCKNSRTEPFEVCRRADDAQGISELIDISRRVRLGNSTFSDDGVQGRLEVFYANKWGTVCDDHFDANDTLVACRMLGYTKGDFKGSAYFGQGTESILFDDMACSGDEANLMSCRRKETVHDCKHKEDVGVICWN